MKIRLLGVLIAYSLGSFLNLTIAEEQINEIRTVITSSDLSLKERERVAELNKCKGSEAIDNYLTKEIQDKYNNLNKEIAEKPVNEVLIKAKELAIDSNNRYSPELQKNMMVSKLKGVIDEEAYKKLNEKLIELKTKEEQSAEYYNAGEIQGAKLYIFVSWSMGEQSLHDLMRTIGDDKNTIIVFRGVLNGDSITSGIKRIHDLMKSSHTTSNPLEKKAERFILPPNVIIDPTLFDDYGINSVPYMLLVDSKDTLTNGRFNVLFFMQGITNKTFFYEKIKTKVSSEFSTIAENEKNLGIYGNVFDIAEPNLIDVMKENAQKVNWEEKKAKAIKNYWQKVEMIKLPHAVYHRFRLVDPSIITIGDVRDSYGKILVKAGQKINPIDYAPINKTIIVFNGTNKTEIESVKSYLKQHNIEQNDPSITLIASEIDRTKAWEGYSDLIHKEFNHHIFMLPKSMVTTFNLNVTPTVISIDRVKKLVVLEELGTIPSEKEVIIETRKDREFNVGALNAN